mmetsp:Transcript_28277/g.64045  ORF Transcript_28277/g.64045 Transcript_28277/m.64045 type:complete len:202 (-) Transcript_28277:372-977(-)
MAPSTSNGIKRLPANVGRGALKDPKHDGKAISHAGSVGNERPQRLHRCSWRCLYVLETCNYKQSLCFTEARIFGQVRGLHQCCSEDGKAIRKIAENFDLFDGDCGSVRCSSCDCIHEARKRESCKADQGGVGLGADMRDRRGSQRDALRKMRVPLMPALLVGSRGFGSQGLRRNHHDDHSDDSERRGEVGRREVPVDVGMA